MRYVVVAAGFDGTLARDGRCDERSIAALRSLAASGRKLVLVTSRELRNLLDIFPEARLFDYLLAENGAVVYRPAVRESAILAQAPSEVLIHELRRCDVRPLSVGSSVVTIDRVHQDVIADMILRLGLDCHLLPNERSLAVLPADINKASGVDVVLEEMGLSACNLVAIGDAENDLDLFTIAEHCVAVSNAAPALKHAADRITRGAYGEGFVEFARELIDTDLANAPVKRRIVLGTRADSGEVTLPPRGLTVLLSGPRASGKTAYCNSLIAQFLQQRYQCCMIGAYPGRRPPNADIVACGDDRNVPNLGDIRGVLMQPAKSVLVNVAAVAPTARAAFIEGVLRKLEALYAETGRPHAIVVDQAETHITHGVLACANRIEGSTRIYLSSQPWVLARELLQSIEVAVALGDTNALLKAFRGVDVSKTVQGSGQMTVESGQAMVWMRSSGAPPMKVALHPRATPSIIPESAVTTSTGLARSMDVNQRAAVTH